MSALSRKVGVCSVAAGAAVVGLGAAAQASLMVFDYTASPLVASTSTSPYGAISEEIAVLYMDGTYKYAAGGTTYDQNGVTTAIVAGDQTDDSVWFGVHDFKANAGSKSNRGFTGVFLDPGDGGVAGFSITGNQAGNPLNEIDGFNAGDMVDGSLWFETDAGAVVRGVGSSSGTGWGGSTTNEKGIEGDVFVAFYLNESDGVHYGWAELSLPTWGNPFTVTIRRWAYETTPGVAAEVGAIPEPMTLSMLALGASGLLARRRKK